MLTGRGFSNSNLLNMLRISRIQMSEAMKSETKSVVIGERCNNKSSIGRL